MLSTIENTFTLDKETEGEMKLPTVDQIEDILQITDPISMDNRIFKNTLLITKILKTFHKKLCEHFEMAKEETDVLSHCLKFIDTLNLFMNNQSISSILKLMSEINELVLMISNLESKDIILKQIKYTEMTIIYYKKRFFKNLFFGNSDHLAKEIERHLEMVTKSGMFDQRLFKQMQNLFYVVQGRFEAKQRAKLQEVLNDLKSQSIKLKKQRFSYYEDYNDYSDYKNYSNVSGNLYDYNDNFYENDYGRNYYEKDQDLAYSFGKNYRYGHQNQNYFGHHRRNDDAYSENTNDKASTEKENTKTTVKQGHDADDETKTQSCTSFPSIPTPETEKEKEKEKEKEATSAKQNSNDIEVIISQGNQNFNKNKNTQSYYNNHFSNNYLYFYDKPTHNQHFSSSTAHLTDGCLPNQPRNSASAQKRPLENKTNMQAASNRYTPVKNIRCRKTKKDRGIMLPELQSDNNSGVNSNPDKKVCEAGEKNESNNNVTESEATVTRPNDEANINEIQAPPEISSTVQDPRYKQTCYYNNTSFPNNSIGVGMNTYGEMQYNKVPEYNHNFGPVLNSNWVNYCKFKDYCNPTYYFAPQIQNGNIIKTQGENIERQKEIMTNMNLADKNKSSIAQNEDCQQELVSLQKQNIQDSETPIPEMSQREDTPFKELHDSDTPMIDTSPPNVQQLNDENSSVPIRMTKSDELLEVTHPVEKILSNNDVPECDEPLDDLEINHNEDNSDEEICEGDEESETVDNEEIEEEFHEFIRESLGESQKEYQEENYYVDPEKSKNNKIIFENDSDSDKAKQDIISSKEARVLEVNDDHILKSSDENCENEKKSSSPISPPSNDEGLKESTKSYIDSIKNIDPKVLMEIKSKLNEDFKMSNVNNPTTYTQNPISQMNPNIASNQTMGMNLNMMQFYQRQFLMSNFIPIQNYLFSNYAHLFYRGRDSNIHREYFALKCLEQENPALIAKNVENFENRIVIPIYQRINYNVNKKRGIYFYTFSKYKKLIHRVLGKDKVLKKVKPYGSYMNNFLIDSGDIDICIVPKGGILEFSVYLEKIKEEVVSENYGEHKLSHHTSRYLLLKVMDIQTKFIIDITVHNMLPILNTNLIRLYSLYDQRFHIMGLYIKHWVKINKIHGAADNFLSSYALLLMLIHFLQKVAEPQVLPNLQNIENNVSIYEYNINGETVKCNIYYEEDVGKIKAYMKNITHGQENKDSVTQLLIKFFEYYAYSYDPNTKISIHKDIKDSSKKKPDNIAFSIEDPFDVHHNPGKSMIENSVQYNKFITSMKKEIIFILNGEYVKRIEKINSSTSLN